MVVIGLRPGFHYTTNATTTTLKQSDYKVEQSSFTLIAFVLLKIGRCRGRNWLNGNQALLRSLQLEETEQLITMPVKLAMLQSNCSRVSKLLGTESETCLQRCLRPLRLYGDQALSFYSIQSRPSNLIDVFYFQENNKWTTKPVNCFLQDGASAGMWSLQTSIARLKFLYG